jgi:sulfite reductase (ferredoxin)
MEERKILPHDPRWTAFIAEAHGFRKGPQAADIAEWPAASRRLCEWAKTNVYRQLQPSYAVVTITLPIGDLTSYQARHVADLARKYCGENVRTTVEQNLVLRWVAEKDLPDCIAN